VRSSRDTSQATNHPSVLLARRPGAAAGIIAAVIYAILGYALSGQPPSSLPPALARLVAFAPHLIAAINASALIVLLRGRAAIRAGRVASHRRLMLTAAVLISGFLVLYVTRVALGGTKAFPGPATVRVYLYLPLLAIHVLLSIISVPLVVYNLLVGLTRPIGAIGVTPHPRVGRTAVALWSVSLALGIVVYVMLNLVY
jgi:putative membrane protein